MILYVRSKDIAYGCGIIVPQYNVTVHSHLISICFQNNYFNSSFFSHRIRKTNKTFTSGRQVSTPPGYQIMLASCTRWLKNRWLVSSVGEN